MRQSGGTSLSTNTILSLLDAFAIQGGKRIYFYGGEPTADENFPDILLYASQRLQEIIVVTNGFYLNNDDVCKALIDASRSVSVWVRVSLNAGTCKTHDRLHKVEGAFHHIVQGMNALTSQSSTVRLAVSVLLQDSNANELLEAYNVSKSVNAHVYTLRPMTGLHGKGLIPITLMNRRRILDAIELISSQATNEGIPLVQVPAWYLQWLHSGQLPDTAKSYMACYFCASSRLVISPPDPGVVWACPYWRSDPRSLSQI